jgi:2-dehydropantoate 2-reductase
VELPTPTERAARWEGALTRRAIPGQTALAGSAWQSLFRRTGSIESDYVNGEITLLGRLHGIPTPANALIQGCSALLARQRKPPGSVALKDLATAIGIC